MDKVQNDTRRDIMLKSGELFFKFGIRSVSIDDISKALGMSKKTFYAYFATKDELVEALLEMNIEHMRSKYLEMIEQPLNDQLRCFVERQSKKEDIRRVPQLVFDLQKYYPKQFEVFQRKNFEMHRTMVLENLKKGVAEGLIRDDVDLETVAFIVAKFHADTIRDAEQMENDGHNVMQMTRCAIDVVLRGLVKGNV